ncbi:MAG: nuclear transport factor 2 family protein [Planctomycetota bacterium]
MPARTPEEAAQAQLDAYNARDLEAFLACYTEDVEVFDLPGTEAKLQGREAMRPVYGRMFDATPDLHCELVARLCHDRFVIDQEYVTGRAEPVRAVATYEVIDGLIRRVWFLR